MTFKDGTWNGVFRKFGPDGNLQVFGRCRNGKLVGKCWKFFSGGGALFGDIGLDDMIEGDDVTYLYPDFITCLKVINFDKTWSPIHHFIIFREALNRKN